MEKLIKNTLLVVLMSISGLAMADEGGASKCSNSKSVASQLNRKMEEIASQQAIPNGTVMIRYTIDEDNKIHIADIQTNDLSLKEIVMNSLEGQSVKLKGEHCNEGFVRMNFVETNSKTKSHFQF
ncbi:MAG TPA: hypothetical protein VK750_07400 [Cytophagaceae bacterium]|jgi:hypothetical protein|nr:hypothetical protein [Cytophagaceae bacterium]